MKLGGTVAAVGFPDIGLQGFAPDQGGRWQVSGETASRHMSIVTRHILASAVLAAAVLVLVD